MQFNMNLPGLESVIVTTDGGARGEFLLTCRVTYYKAPMSCCGERTSRIHDYRIQKVQHLKVFKRTSYLFYRKRKYVCSCGKRFAENNQVVDRYQRHSKEWNQALGLCVIKGKNFKDTASQFRTSQTTAIRRFNQISAVSLEEVDTLPPVNAKRKF